MRRRVSEYVEGGREEEIVEVGGLTRTSAFYECFYGTCILGDIVLQLREVTMYSPLRLPPGLRPVLWSCR